MRICERVNGRTAILHAIAADVRAVDHMETVGGCSARIGTLCGSSCALGISIWCEVEGVSVEVDPGELSSGPWGAKWIGFCSADCVNDT